MKCKDCGDQIEFWALEQYPDADLCSDCSAGMKHDVDDRYYD